MSEYLYLWLSDILKSIKFKTILFIFDGELTISLNFVLSQLIIGLMYFRSGSDCPCR